MPINTVRMDVKCEQCGATAEISESLFTNHRKQSITALKETQFQLPKGWMSMEWWSKAQAGAGYPTVNENVLDEADFCSIECVIKFFQKKRKFLKKEVEKKIKLRKEL